VARIPTTAEEKAYAMRIMGTFIALSERVAIIDDIDDMSLLTALYMLSHGVETRVKEKLRQPPGGLSFPEMLAHMREVSGIMYDAVATGKAPPEAAARLTALMKGVGR
jgi:hypothetical protein